MKKVVLFLSASLLIVAPSFAGEGKDIGKFIAKKYCDDDVKAAETPSDDVVTSDAEENNKDT